MKFALVNGQRQEAQPGLSGECPVCESPVIAKCGENRIRMWHWAHKSKCKCDPWGENETEWHRNWKDQFPDDWQEVTHRAEDGELHRADVKTEAGWVIEFQHSRIEPKERRSREKFYQKLIWVVDGSQKSYKAGFQRAWNNRLRTYSEDLPGRIVRSDDGALLRNWAGSSAHVFFDLGDEQVLWWLAPTAPNTKKTWAIVARLLRANFIDAHRSKLTQELHGFESIEEQLRQVWRASYGAMKDLYSGPA